MTQQGFALQGCTTIEGTDSTIEVIIIKLNSEFGIKTSQCLEVFQ